MLKAVRLILILAVATCSLPGSAQNLSNKGTEFWVGYGHHQFMEPGQNNSQEMVLYFSAEQAANVTVTVRGRSASQTTNYAVPANSVISSNLIPKGGALDCRLYDVPPTFGGNGGEGTFSLSIHIQSDVPIVAYAHIYGSLSSGATMLMPVETWGHSYYSLNSQQNYGNNNCFSWMYVVAQHDNTVIQVTPSVPTRTGHTAGVPFNVTLNRGQIYQLVGASITSSSGQDLSGTKVTSIANPAGDCYPVAVFSGSSRTAITCPSGGGGSGDNIMQQVFPSQAWGKRYLTAPFSHQNNPSQFNGGVIRIAVKDPATVVKRNGVVLTGLINNFYYQFQSNTADYIEADKPVLVAQYMPSSGQCGYSGFGDPEMIYISPIEQGIKRVGFYRNNEEQITVNYLTLIIPTPGVSSLNINGSTSFSHTYPHPNLSGYTVVVQRWSPATPSQVIVFSDSAFTAITYGLGSVESYGYNAGTLINNLSALSHVHNVPDPATSQHPHTCVGTPIELSALVAYQPTRLDFLLSALGSNITPNADVIMNAPVSSGTAMVNGVPYYKYTLPGTYTFNVADTFIIPLKAYHPSIENCYQRDSLNMQVIVKDRPVAAFNFTHTGCTLDAVNLIGVTPTSNNYNVNAFNWTFPVAPFTATGQNQSLLLPPGTHNIDLEVVTADGCVDDTIRAITVYDRPPAEFQVTPASVCVGSAFTITDTSSATIAVNHWYWDFGDGNTETSTTSPSTTHSYTAAGTYTIKHATRSSVTCVSDTVFRTVTVFDNPTTSFTFPSGCLGQDGLVQFNGSAITSDGQAINTWAWNFGDPNATGGNPNTSALQNPTHMYQPGTYSIQLTATTTNGCIGTVTLPATFNLTPALDYPPLTNVCENLAPLSVAFASVTNGVTGTGVYGGPGTSSTGMFDPAAAGPGIHTITYTFTSGAGCVKDTFAMIEVYPRPVSAFTISGDICQDETLTITPNASVSSGSVTSWNWDLGDGNTPTYTNNNPFNVSYATFNSYTIQLINTSDRGCISLPVTRTVNVHAIPVADFDLPTGICMPGGTANFTNQSNVADNSSLSYVWDFGDGGPGSTATNPSYNYASSGSYNVTLTATSAFGCDHQVSQVMNDFYEKPQAEFTVSPQEVCQGVNQLFSDASTDPLSTIDTWSWNFDDGLTSTQQNPTKQFTNAGTYDVVLVVTNEVGCVSEPFTIPVTVHLQPVIDAGQSFIVPQGTQVQFTATANSPSLTFSWSPPFGLDDETLLKPTLTAMSDQVYTLTATNDFGCTATDFITVKILKPVKIPNVFSPNNDGIHDKWTLENLSDYPGATVEIFNRYGQQVFISSGYGTPWDGTSRGKDLPVGTYYYVIKLNNGFKPITGSVTILR